MHISAQAVAFHVFSWFYLELQILARVRKSTVSYSNAEMKKIDTGQGID